jgi:ATP synthase protein I
MKQETARWLREMAFYASLGMSVALSIVIGLAIGLWLDRVFQTGPWLMFVFLGMGIAAAFRNILLVMNRAKRM